MNGKMYINIFWKKKSSSQQRTNTTEKRGRTKKQL